MPASIIFPSLTSTFLFFCVCVCTSVPRLRLVTLANVCSLFIPFLHRDRLDRSKWHDNGRWQHVVGVFIFASDALLDRFRKQLLKFVDSLYIHFWLISYTSNYEKLRLIIRKRRNSPTCEKIFRKYSQNTTVRPKPR